MLYKKLTLIYTYALFFSFNDLYTSCISTWDPYGQNINGQSAALNSEGTILVIGEPSWSGSQGKVSIYQNTGNTWLQIGSSIVGQDATAEAGTSVALSSDGTILVIGEPGWSGNQGIANVYRNLGNDYEFFNSIAGQNTDDKAGTSVAVGLKGTITTVAVGEPGWSGSQGKVSIYQNTGTAWATGLSIVGQDATAEAGISVALSSDGTMLVIGEPGWSGNQGIANVYINSGNDFEFFNSIAGQNTGDKAGTSVAVGLKGTITTVAVGEPGYNNNQGKVKIYKHTETGWTPGSSIVGQDAAAEAGTSVALSSDGTMLVIGEPGWSGNQGLITIFENIKDSWLQRSYIISDSAGYSVALNADGTILAESGLPINQVRVFKESCKQNIPSYIPSKTPNKQNPGGKQNLSQVLQEAIAVHNSAYVVYPSGLIQIRTN